VRIRGTLSTVGQERPALAVVARTGRGEALMVSYINEFVI